MKNYKMKNYKNLEGLEILNLAIRASEDNPVSQYFNSDLEDALDDKGIAFYAYSEEALELASL